MPIVHRRAVRRRARTWLSAVAGATLILAALVGPAAAHAGRPPAQGSAARLSEVTVSPRLARPSTPIQFAIVYRHSSGERPAHVGVLIDGRRFEMRATGARTADGRGLWFGYARKLAPGRHRIAFLAVGTDGKIAIARGGTVRITRKSTRGGGSSGAGGSDGAGSSGSPADGSPSGAGDIGSGGDGTPARPSGGPPSNASEVPALDPADGAGAGDVGAPGSAASALDGLRRHGLDDLAGEALLDAVHAVDGDAVRRPDERVVGSPHPPPVGAVLSSSDSGSAGSGGPSGGEANPASPTGPVALGIGGGPFDRVLRAYPVMITTSGMALAWAAFIFFGRRRRDGEPPAPDPVLAANAAAGPEPVPAADLVAETVHGLPVPPGVDPSEAGVPRWRRPSLLQARKTDPLRTASTAVSLTFADGAIGLVEGRERRRIRYRLVRLLDVPDEVRATEIGILDQGDEVQIMETRGTYRLVLCPDGQQGWLHQMVIGELVGDDEPTDIAPDGIDEDVLAAFLAHRRRSA